MNDSMINISVAQRDDLAAIMALETSGFAEAERWSERSWLGELLGESRSTFIARDNRAVGIIALQTVGTTADLHRIVVAPAARRSRVGSQLIKTGLDAVRHLGATSVMLEVRYDNEPAIAFYQRLGFEQLTVRQNYYATGLHALVCTYDDLDKRIPELMVADD